MKFIHYLEKISGVSVYGLSSLLIFGLFFLVMTIWALRADKHMIEELRNLPLDKLKTGGKISVVLMLVLLPGAGVYAAGPPVASTIDHPYVVFAIIIIIILAMAIALLANVLLGAAQIPKDNRQDETYAGGISRTGSARSMLPVFLLIPGISDTAFYMISCVIILEVIVLLVLLYNVKLILSIHKKDRAKAAAVQAATAPAVPRISWWDKMNRFKPMEQEVDLDLGHDYDGIRELDNRLPPWWLYSFYGCIVFACVYLWRYHVAHTAPLSQEEYTIAVQVAEVQKAAYLKKAASQVDENTVKLLTSADDLAEGRNVFETTCFTCHGKSGEGGVGPNLTDEYWLHGGSIQDVFKSIKYGWADKGMKSWKDDFPPVRIAQIASYIASLQGTHPANAKAPQGGLSK
jgi:cytochrome c oxidase cbb3-type subunit 3